MYKRGMYKKMFSALLALTLLAPSAPVSQAWAMETAIRDAPITSGAFTMNDLLLESHGVQVGLPVSSEKTFNMSDLLLDDYGIEANLSESTESSAESDSEGSDAIASLELEDDFGVDDNFGIVETTETSPETETEETTAPAEEDALKAIMDQEWPVIWIQPRANP